MNDTSTSRKDIHVWSSGKDTRSPLTILGDIYRGLRDCHQLAWLLMKRDLTVQYRQSFLGALWVFLPPLFTALGLSMAKNADIVRFADTSIPYPAYVMLSMALWQTFSHSLSAPLTALRSGRSILSKLNFAPEALVLAELGKILFNFCVQLLLVAMFFLWYRIPVSWSLLAMPVTVLLLVLTGTAIGLFLAPIGALYRDVSNGLGIITSTWLLLTPVIYPPTSTDGLFRLLTVFNPVTPILVTARELTTGHALTHLTSFFIVLIVVLALLPISIRFFRVTTSIVVERWSS